MKQHLLLSSIGNKTLFTFLLEQRESWAISKSDVLVHLGEDLELALGPDSLGAGVDGQLSREQKPHCSLDLSPAESCLLVPLGNHARLPGNPLEQIADQRVHYAHRFGRDRVVWLHKL